MSMCKIALKAEIAAAARRIATLETQLADQRAIVAADDEFDGLYGTDGDLGNIETARQKTLAARKAAAELDKETEQGSTE